MLLIEEENTGTITARKYLMNIKIFSFIFNAIEMINNSMECF